MKLAPTKRKTIKKYDLDVEIILASKSSEPEDRRRMTDHQIGVNLHKYCPHIIATTGMTAINPEYTKKKVTAKARVYASTGGRAIDIVSNEIVYRLDSVYLVMNAKVKRQ